MHDTNDTFEGLLHIIQRLRGPDGCAWDKEQTPHTLRENLIEEAYECVSAINASDEENFKEELGDLFMLVTMLAWMKEQEGTFTVPEVFRGINEKLIRRHPHVFGDAKANSVSEILDQWDRIKKEEKQVSGEASAVAGLPASLPPLERAYKIQKKVSKVGFDWGSPDPVVDKLREETQELERARATGDRAKIEDEVGDMLFTVVNLARILGVDPGLALHGTNEKFLRRFASVEELLRRKNLTPEQAGLKQMDALWDQVKSEEQNNAK